jgi:hypothetical protein
LSRRLTSHVRMRGAFRLDRAQHAPSLFAERCALVRVAGRASTDLLLIRHFAVTSFGYFAGPRRWLEFW